MFPKTKGMQLTAKYCETGPEALISLAWKVMAAMASNSDADAENHAALEQKFLAMVRREESLISAICFSYACSVAEYDDLRQDAMLNLWRGIDSFKGESAQRTWVYRVVINSCVSTIRKQSRYGKESESLDKLYDLVNEPEEDRERIENLHRSISSLNAEDKAIILMWLDEASYDDIASVMGMPRNTVATRIHRIKDKLASKIIK